MEQLRKSDSVALKDEQPNHNRTISKRTFPSLARLGRAGPGAPGCWVRPLEGMGLPGRMVSPWSSPNKGQWETVPSGAFDFPLFSPLKSIKATGLKAFQAQKNPPSLPVHRLALPSHARHLRRVSTRHPHAGLSSSQPRGRNSHPAPGWLWEMQNTVWLGYMFPNALPFTGAVKSASAVPLWGRPWRASPPKVFFFLPLSRIAANLHPSWVIQKAPRPPKTVNRMSPSSSLGPSTASLLSGFPLASMGHSARSPLLMLWSVRAVGPMTLEFTCLVGTQPRRVEGPSEPS